MSIFTQFLSFIIWNSKLKIYFLEAAINININILLILGVLKVFFYKLITYVFKSFMTKISVSKLIIKLYLYNIIIMNDNLFVFF